MTLTRRLTLVVWPAFMAAAGAELVFFAIFDPFDLHFFGAPLDLSRHAIYAMGFFGFWGLGIASSALTLVLGLLIFAIALVRAKGTELGISWN